MKFLHELPGIYRGCQKLTSQVKSSPPTSISTESVNGFRREILDWYETNSRILPWRQLGASSYVRIVVEVLLQRTRAETVASYLASFLHHYPDWKTLAAAEREHLSMHLKPLGLWQRRTTSLSGLAKAIAHLDGRWPRERRELELLPAVGQYVASAVLLFEHGKREALMDASMARLLRRYFDLKPQKADIRYDRLLQETAYRILADDDPIALNWAMLDFAAVYCKVRDPLCANCPLRDNCKFPART